MSTGISIWVGLVGRLGLPMLGLGLLSALPKLDRGTGQYVGVAFGLSLIYFFFLGVPLALLMNRFDRPRRQGNGLVATPWVPASTKVSIQLPTSKDESFARALDAATGLPDASISKADSAKGLIKATFGLTWRSAGERLHVQVRPNGLGGTTLVVRSKPKLPTTMFDGGKNRDNVERFLSLLADD